MLGFHYSWQTRLLHHTRTHTRMHSHKHIRTQTGGLRGTLHMHQAVQPGGGALYQDTTHSVLHCVMIHADVTSFFFLQKLSPPESLLVSPRGRELRGETL